jgi:large subunit ribosomal protein L10
LPTEEKAQAIEEMKDWMGKASIVISTDYTGLPVSEMTQLRRTLREKEVQYKIVKNTLAYRAADESGRPGIKEIIQGPTAVAFSYGEPVDPAKALSDFIRTRRSPLKILGGVLDGRVLSAADVDNLATLPSKEELYSKLLGQMQAPSSSLVRVLNESLARLARVLQAHVDQASQ